MLERSLDTSSLPYLKILTGMVFGPDDLFRL